MPKITMFHTEWNGCAYWRVFQPAKFLNKLSGNEFEVVYFEKEKQLKGSIEYYYEKCKGSDLIVSMRCDNIKSVQMLMVLRHMCKVPLVFETDDDFQNVDKLNIASKHWERGGEPFTAATMQMEESDALQFSTMPLKRSFGYKLGKPTFVMPNLIDLDLASHRVLNDSDTIRIVWAGSASHYQDLKMVMPAIERILSEYKNVRFASIGMRCDYMYEGEGKDRKLRDGFEYIEGCSFKHWNQLLGSSKADIAIVPLEDMKFNVCKSNCRYLEWSVLKVPGIYSEVYPYAKTITHLQDGFKIPMFAHNRVASKGTIESWYKYLKMLIESKDLRTEIGERAFETVKDNYSLQNNISIWADNYSKIYGIPFDLRDIDEAEEAIGDSLCQVQSQA